MVESVRMVNNFWNELKRPFFILAPMEAVTDIAFRHVIAEAAKPDVFFTEFTATDGYCSPKGIAATRGRLEFSEDEQPIVAQIWGNKPENFATMSHDLAAMGFRGIDINMGCPDKSVVKQGSGSGLCQNPSLAAEIIKATKTGGLPVSVKCRLGYSRIDEWRDWLTHLLKQDIVNLTVHLRTKKEMSKVPAHFELIPEIVKLRDEIAPHTLLTINGDIMSRTQGEELARQYGVDGVMIGRGIFHDPWAFEENRGEHSKEELINLLKLHLNLWEKQEDRKYDPLKRFFKIYIRDFPGASDLRQQLMETRSIEEARDILQRIDS